jgi:hypothetical protein
VSDGTVVWIISRDLPLIGGGALTGSALTFNGNDLAGSAIVAQSLGKNGYIKYASGLIMQWGGVNVSNKNDISISYPISFSQPYSCFVSTYGSEDNSPRYFSTNGSTSANYIAFNATTSSNAWLNWFAVGY